jgi:hypothetical protein
MTQRAEVVLSDEQREVLERGRDERSIALVRFGMRHS